METANVFSENIHARGKSSHCNKLNVLSDVKNTLHSARKTGKAVITTSKELCKDDDDQHNHACCELGMEKEMERSELRLTQDIITFYSNFGSILNPFFKTKVEENRNEIYPEIEDVVWTGNAFFEPEEISFDDVKLCVSSPSC